MEIKNNAEYREIEKEFSAILSPCENVSPMKNPEICERCPARCKAMCQAMEAYDRIRFPYLFK